MGSVNFSGVGTGVDWSVLIEAEVQARQARTIEPLEDWKESWEDKLSVFSTLSSHLINLQSSVQAMDTLGELRSYAVSTTDSDVLTAAVTGTPTTGAHDIEVNQLAGNESEVHAGVDDEGTVINNTGAEQQFAYTYAGETFSVDVADGLTLAQLAGLINNDADNPGVVASVLDDGSGSATSHHLLLRGADSGASYTIEIDAAGTSLDGDWASLTADAAGGAGSVTVDDASPFTQYQAILIEDDDSTAEYHIIGSVAGTTLNLQGILGDDFTTAQNAYVTPRGIGCGLAAAAAAGNATISVDDASQFQLDKTILIADGSGYEEVVISEIDTTANTITITTTLTNSYGADAYATQLEGGRRFSFDDTDFTEVQAARNAQVRLDGYPAGSWIERENNVIADLIPGITLTLTGKSDGSTVGVTVNTDAAGVKTKIEAFVNAYNTVKRYLNEQTSYDPDTEEAGMLLGNYGAEIVESMLRDTLLEAAPGFLDGTDAYTYLAQIGITTLGLTEDKAALGTLQIDEDMLDEALAEDFEEVVALFADANHGFSDSSYLTFYQSSALLTEPGIYEVEATFDGAGNLTAGRFRTQGQSEWRDADVDSPYVVGASGNPEDNLWVKATWDGISTTQTATVRVREGIAPSIAEALTDILDPTDGMLQNLEDSYRDIINQIDTRIEQEEGRIDLMEERLTEQYSRLEEILVRLQAQQQWLEAMA